MLIFQRILKGQITKYCKLQSQILPAVVAGAVQTPRAEAPYTRPLESLKMNLFGETKRRRQEQRWQTHKETHTKKNNKKARKHKQDNTYRDIRSRRITKQIKRKSIAKQNQKQTQKQKQKQKQKQSKAKAKQSKSKANAKAKQKQIESKLKAKA